MDTHEQVRELLGFDVEELFAKSASLVQQFRQKEAEDYKTLREAFEDHVERRGKSKWRWHGSVNSAGYPKMRDGSKIRLVSHVALELSGRGPVADDKVVEHLDDDPGNIAPSNLRVVTQKENLQHMEDKGRWRKRGPDDGPRKTAELKTAKPRAVREWQQAMQQGDQGAADQIARAYGQLDLNPRYLKDLSVGGLEAGTDLMMGNADRAMNPNQFGAPASGPVSKQQMQDRVLDSALGGLEEAPRVPNESGYTVRKLYKPDSPVSQGLETSMLLGDKKKFTDQARSLSPQAKNMVADMYGYKEHFPQGQSRHTSYHEYVPNIQNLPETTQGRIPHVGALMRDVTDPMKAKGMNMGDLPFLDNREILGNAPNLVLSNGKPKVLDFIPHGPQAMNPNKMDQFGLVTYGTPEGDRLRTDSQKYRPAEKVLPPVMQNGALDEAATKAQNAAFDKETLGRLRTDVFNPAAAAKQPVSPLRAGAHNVPFQVTGQGTQVMPTVKPPMLPSKAPAPATQMATMVGKAPSQLGTVVGHNTAPVTSRVPGMMKRLQGVL